MSHHLDSPASRQDPRLNTTDLYAFDGDTGVAFVLAVNTSLGADGRVAGFHPEARYEIKVHLDGADLEDVTYRVSFGDADDDGRQPLTVDRLTGPDAADDSAPGRTVARGCTGEVVPATGGGPRVWAGRVADPFYLDLHQLAHVVEGLQGRTPIDLAGWEQADAASSFTGSSVEAIVLEVPADGELRPGRRIGVWAAAKLATDAGGWHQVNRTAIPMVWPLFRALGGDDESLAYARDTAGHPADDPANDGDRVRDLVTAAARTSGSADPEGYADQVADRLLPDLLPYTVGTRAAFGFAGFNGRRLADNAPEVMYSLVTNRAFPSGLTSRAATATRSEHFPYVVPAAGQP
jgi:Domain of unknown function (DUF4331)